MTVPSVSLSWSPYLVFDNCNQEGSECKSNHGILTDMAKYLGELLNFTVVTTREPEGDWGVYPRSGPFDFTGEWAGVMGKVDYKVWEINILQLSMIFTGGQGRLCS